MKITIGADPELFIIDNSSSKVVSAVGMIPGEKGDPYTEGMPKGFGLETDNILAEFNIPPAKTKSSFINSVMYMQNYISEFVKRINENFGIQCKASNLIDSDQLQSDQAKEFGCSIDYNVYTQKPNPKPKGTKTNLRSAGFHVHCGYPTPNIEQSLKLIKYFDLYLGVPSILIDDDTQRRSLYGKAGCFRICDYGFEYRTLSSAMMLNKGRLSFIWDQIQKAITAYELSKALPSQTKIQKAINKSDKDVAKTLIDTYNLCVELPE